MHTALTLLLLVLWGVHAARDDKWKTIRDGLDTWAALDFDTSFSFNVGDATGTKFTYTKGNTTMNSRLPGASLSKWPAAVMVAGLVADGTMSFDDTPGKYIKWWTTDPSDSRANITLAHLLSFTSGYTEDGMVLCAANPEADFLSCAEQLYKKLKHAAPSGSTFTYLSCHLQFAGAMAVAASGKPIDVLFRDYMYQPLGMNGTTWGQPPYKNPQMATGITTTGNDFEKFLRGMLDYSFRPKAVLDVMERDWTAPPVSPSGDGWFGHYAMGHWFECLGYGTGSKAGASAALPERCNREHIQAGPGLYAYYPLIDRVRGYYMQVVIKEAYAKTGIPEYLRIVSKPVVDAVMAGVDDTEVNRQDLLEAGGGLLLRDLAYIQSSLKGSQPRPTSDVWGSLRDGLDSWALLNFTTSFSFNVGDASGRKFLHTVGNTTMNSRLLGASLSKWPAAVMVAGLVADGTMSFDDTPGKYIKWWTTDPSDSRANITLAHLLSFTSGYTEDGDVACAGDPSADFLSCAEQLYKKLKHAAPSGSTFTYLSCHLQFAGAMAVAASGKPIDVLFRDYMYQPLGMNGTTWGQPPYKNPQMATGITTTGNDFEKFLRGMLDYSFRPKAVLDVMERDWTAPPVSPSGDGWFGHYAMGHWFECLGYGTGSKGTALPERCNREHIQAGPGAFAYYPLIDRVRGYYMQVVLQETYEKSGIPEYLRIVSKPMVDSAMAGVDSADINREDLLKAGGGLILRDLVYIQGEL